MWCSIPQSQDLPTSPSRVPLKTTPSGGSLGGGNTNECYKEKDVNDDKSSPEIDFTVETEDENGTPPPSYAEAEADNSTRL